MGKKRRILFAALLVVVLGGLGWMIFHTQEPPEPVYKGQPLRYWLAGYDAGNSKAAHPNGPPSPTWNEANEAVRQMGTNAVPVLLRMLRERDAGLKSRLNALARKQHFIRVGLWSPIIETKKAELAFARLGPQPMNLAPELIKIYEAQPCVISRQVVPEILCYAAPLAPETTPFLLRVLANDRDQHARANAAVAIRVIHPKAALVMPALIKGLEDANPRIRANAAITLMEYQADARPAIPTLLRLRAAGKAKVPPAPPIGPVGIQTGFSWALPGSPEVAFAASALRQKVTLEDVIYEIDREAAAKAGIK